jgi:peptide/nickel transport system substrate-binding protein
MRGVLTALALVLGASAAWAGEPGTLTIGLSQFPPDMHPDVGHTSVKDYVLDAASRPVVSFDLAGNVVCVLCTEVPSIKNGLAKVVDLPGGGKGMEVTFHLRDDIFWGDGVKVTARDVAFAFRVAKAFAPTPNVVYEKAVDDHTVVVSLDATRYDFARLIDRPLPEHIEAKRFAAAKAPLDYDHASAYNSDPTNPGLWDGPYRITGFVANQTITLEPNPYWRGTKPGYAKVAMRLLENTAALEANLLSGDVDTISTAVGLSLDQVLGLEKAHPDRFTYFYLSTPAYEHLALDLANPLLADRRVRQAMMMAIDRQTIVSKLFRGKQKVAGSFLEPSQFGWHKDTKIWPYDPVAAKKLLAEAGFKPGADGVLVSPGGERFALTLITTSGNYERQLVEQVLQTEFRAIGIAVDIRNEPARTMFGETLWQRQFTGMVLYSTDPSPDLVPFISYDSQAIPTAANSYFGKNYVGYSSKAMDAALETARTELDPGRRYADWKTILDLYAEDVPELPLFFQTEAFIEPQTLTGMVPPKYRDYSTMWLEDWRAK